MCDCLGGPGQEEGTIEAWLQRVFGDFKSDQMMSISQFMSFSRHFELRLSDSALRDCFQHHADESGNLSFAAWQRCSVKLVETVISSTPPSSIGQGLWQLEIWLEQNSKHTHPRDCEVSRNASESREFSKQSAVQLIGNASRLRDKTRKMFKN